MSFQNQAFWLAKNPGCLDGADMTAYENSSRNGADMTTYENSSRIESKRPHQWFMDSPEVDLFPNKKPAVEVSSNTFLTGMPSSNTPSWGNSSCFQLYTGHFTEQLFEPNAATRTTNFENRNISSVSIDKLSVERKDKTEPFGGDSSFGLSISTTLEDPQSGFNYGGIRKVKVSEVKESENVMSVHTNNPYERVDNNTLSNSHAYKGGDNSMSTSLTYNKGDENIIFMDNACGRTDNNFISMGQSYNKGDDSLSMGQSYKEICDTISIDQGFSKVDSNVISIAQAYNKTDGNSMSRDHIFNNVEEGIITVGHTYYDKGGNNMPLVAHSFNKRGSTIISFGGCDDDDITPSGGLVSSYEQLMGQAPSHNIESMNDKQLVKSNSLSSTALTSASAIENVSKIKEEIKMSKKATSNNFPSNVRSLLSTGILDGVPIKYKAWSQEELRGVIKGSGYLCSCQSCNFSKLINAYEFERHAGCKTKHPNNHIYFENGKTIYGIVQELRSTPQHMLFEVIQTITGSPINQKSFRSWKESFLAATKELQRIYGKDEEKQLS